MLVYLKSFINTQLELQIIKCWNSKEKSNPGGEQAIAGNGSFEKLLQFLMLKIMRQTAGEGNIRRKHPTLMNCWLPSWNGSFNSLPVSY